MIETFFELKEKSKEKNLVDFILKTQSAALDITKEELIQKIEKIAEQMQKTIQNGLNSNTPSLSKLSGFNTSIIKNAQNSDNTPDLLSNLQKKAILYSIATIEENARMGKIAACPTAGSSGILPSVLIAAKEEFNKTTPELINALVIAGETGRIISNKMQLAGAVAGCQAECGAASAMASGGLCYLLGYNIDIIFEACALNLKNIMGLTCDPVAGLVEIPCVKRNMFLASHAICASYLAISGIKSCIPLDEVVDAARETGILMSPKLKESAEAGLAVTKTGLKIADEIFKK